MTRQPDCTLSDDLMRMIAEQGLDALPELIRIMLNAAMQAERQQYLRAAPKMWPGAAFRDTAA